MVDNLTILPYHEQQNIIITIMKACIYCTREVITNEQEGYLYAIDTEQDELIQYAHSECAQMGDNILVDEVIV